MYDALPSLPDNIVVCQAFLEGGDSHVGLVPKTATCGSLGTRSHEGVAVGWDCQLLSSKSNDADSSARGLGNCASKFLYDSFDFWSNVLDYLIWL